MHSLHGRRLTLRPVAAADRERLLQILENARAIRCYTKVGFRPVGVMRQYERVAPGGYRDALLMDLLAEELTDEPQRVGEGGERGRSEHADGGS